MVINAGVELALVKRVTARDKHIYTVTGEGVLFQQTSFPYLKGVDMPPKSSRKIIPVSGNIVSTHLMNSRGLRGR